MAKRNELYKCAECGNIVEVLVGGECGVGKMEHVVENTTDAAT
ncbi:MAG: DNA topoisomerase II, partial [Prevotella fusca]